MYVCMGVNMCVLSWLLSFIIDSVIHKTIISIMIQHLAIHDLIVISYGKSRRKVE